MKCPLAIHSKSVSRARISTMANEDGEEEEDKDDGNV